MRGGTGSGSVGGQSNGNDQTDGEEAAKKRKIICDNLQTLYTARSCNIKATELPLGAEQLQIPGSYSTALIWENRALSFAQWLFNNPTSDARSAAGTALREAYTLCNNSVQCQSEVFQYFGVNTTSYPPLGALGDINGAYNSVLASVLVR